jgi:uroporphyrinogen decarboxylase
MTPRERWLAMFTGGKPDRVPCDYWGTAEVTARLRAELACNSDRQLWERLGIDKCIHLAARHPRASQDEWHVGSAFAVWGIGAKEITYQGGNATYLESGHHPLASAQSPADIQAYAWPDPEEWDLSDMRQRCQEWAGYPLLGGAYEPFYLYCNMRGLERAYEDLVLNHALLDAALERIFRIHEAVIRRTLEVAGDLIDFIYVSEDLGNQQGLLMSPACFHKLFKPRMKRMIDLVHSFGVRVFHHDDGSIRGLLPDLIEAGIDILNPIQWRCQGMEREALARDFGSALVFHGGMDNQETLPFGKPDDVKREVAENVRIFGKCKGYVVAPCHNLQPITPTENIVALYEAVHELS